MAALTTFPTRWFASFVVKERWPFGLAVVSGGVGVNINHELICCQQPKVDFFTRPQKSPREAGLGWVMRGK